MALLLSTVGASLSIRNPKLNDAISPSATPLADSFESSERLSTDLGVSLDSSISILEAGAGDGL
jgi:hypothetical protein